ncbi:MAG: hypothetical protein M1358_05735 [Chloroflexi bacterium]|nr:hypothetical protein [Chloroflexota bacterium]
MSWKEPDPMLFSNIPLMWKFLDLIVQDWKRDAARFQAKIDDSVTEDERSFNPCQAFLDLQPRYLYGLFSYTFFFTALERAYDQLYEQLNALNRDASLRVKHDKKPTGGSLVDKIKMIRNLSVAHMGSPRQRRIDVKAAAMWQPLAIGKAVNEPWNLVNYLLTLAKFYFYTNKDVCPKMQL